MITIVAGDAIPDIAIEMSDLLLATPYERWLFYLFGNLTMTKFLTQFSVNPDHRDSQIMELAPSAAVTKGQCVVLGSIAGVATKDIAKDEPGPVQVDGIVTMVPRVAGTTFTVGAKCYSANASNKVNDSAANSLTTFIGYALEASANDSTSPIKVWLVRGGA